MWRLAAFCVVLLAGCEGDEADRARQMEQARERGVALGLELRGGPAISDQALVFRLAFDRSVDLDLYVTDPLEETAYFANHDTEAGGRLVSDIRCDSEAGSPAVEEIRFDAPYPGSYRVGVDFPEACAESDDVAGFAVSVRGAGEAHAVNGVIEMQRFEPVVLEFDLEGRR
jgi:hypothetical protein